VSPSDNSLPLTLGNTESEPGTVTVKERRMGCPVKTTVLNSLLDLYAKVLLTVIISFAI
jgi:hypothetical protein